VSEVDFAQDIRLAEALIFASAQPVLPSAILRVLSDFADLDAVMQALQARYQGGGVELVQAAGGWQFRTAPDLAASLRQVVEVPRRLPRVAMETLAIVAYHQPVTRAEIEEIRGAGLSPNTMDQLLEFGLIAPVGRKETPGRPTLWATTPEFLAHFGLKDLRQLPRRDDVLTDSTSPLLAPREPGPISHP
jgi:segregation and condensation protein B